MIAAAPRVAPCARYEVEVGFYNDVASTVDVRTPRCHLAAIDLETHDFVLLLDDLAPARQGDQLAGCDVDLAERVLDQAAAFHAPAGPTRPSRRSPG